MNGKIHEPVEHVTIDVPEDYLGVVTQMLALRKGRMEQMVNHGTGWVRMEYLVPARGLIGFRTEFMTETRGTGMLHHVFDRYEPWHGALAHASDRAASCPTAAASRNTFALMNLQERGQMLVGPGVEVYEGMIVGENARSEEMDVNPTKEKKLTNMRAAGSDDTVRLVPPRPMSLEQALEFIADDECVEVTPHNVRLRKVVLDQSIRGRARSNAKHGSASPDVRLVVKVGNRPPLRRRFENGGPTPEARDPTPRTSRRSRSPRAGRLRDASAS